MPLKRTSHEVYDTKYHLAWAPKYRRWIVREDIRRRLEQVFREVEEDFGFEHEARLNEPPVGSEAQSSRFRVGGLYLIGPGLLGRLVKRLDEHVHAPEDPKPVTLQVLPRSGGNRRGFS